MYLQQNRNPVRVLSDRGIRQAIRQGMIQIVPSFDERKDSQRIQPASLDVELYGVEDCEPISYRDGHFQCASEKLTIPSRYISTAGLTELIDFGQLRHRKYVFLGASVEARSSIRRLGGFIARAGGCFYSNPERTELEIGNFGPNDIKFHQEERIAQVIFTVDPFADKRFEGIVKTPREVREQGEQVRELEMGIEVCRESQIHHL